MLWEKISESAVIRTFEQMMRDDNLRPAPAPVIRLTLEKDRAALGLATGKDIWDADPKIYRDYMSFLKIRRLAYEKRTASEHRDKSSIRNPDTRKHSRNKYVIDLQEYFRDPLRAMPTTSQEKEKDDADKDFVADDEELTSEPGSMATSDESTEAEGESKDGKKPQKKRRKRRGKFSTRVDPQEVEELMKTAGAPAPELRTTCPESITLDDAYKLLGVVPDNERDFAQQAVALVNEQESRVMAWRNAKAKAELHERTGQEGLKKFRPRKAKEYVPTGHYGLEEPDDPEMRAQLGLDGRERSQVEAGVPQDTTKFDQPQFKVTVTRKKPAKKRKQKRTAGESKYKSKDAYELGILARRRYRAQTAQVIKDNVFPDAPIAACKEFAMGYESDSDKPPSAGEFERTMTITRGVPAVLVAPRVSVGDQPGTSGTGAPVQQPKHRHEGSEDEAIPLHPALIARAAETSESSLEEESEPEGPDEYEKGGTSSSASSQDDPESDATVKSVELSDSSADSQLSAKKASDDEEAAGDAGESAQRVEDKPEDATAEAESTAAQKPKPKVKRSRRGKKSEPTASEQQVLAKEIETEAPNPPGPPAAAAAVVAAQATPRSPPASPPALPPAKRTRRSARLRGQEPPLGPIESPLPQRRARKTATKK